MDKSKEKSSTLTLDVWMVLLVETDFHQLLVEIFEWNCSLNSRAAVAPDVVGAGPAGPGGRGGAALVYGPPGVEGWV